MKRIALLLFHKEPEVCLNRIELFRYFNPDVGIFGLFGGKEDEFETVKTVTGSALDHLYLVAEKSNVYKKRHTDLLVRQWYKDYGNKVEFDTACVLQWDMLLFGPLAGLYKGIDTGAVGLTGLTEMKKISYQWDWTRGQFYQLLLNFQCELQMKHDYRAEPYACLGPGYCLPKIFLEKYSAMELSYPAVHDEIRLPAYAQVLGFELKDTGFYRKWYSREEQRFFNCDRQEIREETILEELQKPDGRRAFHPYNGVFNLQNLNNFTEGNLAL